MPTPHASQNHRNNSRSAPHGHGRSGGQGHQKSEGQSTLAYISAPYNFVPLSERIFIPSWGQDVSHDIPFQDGFSGELHYTLVAHTPLLVGGRQAKADKDRPGEVKPFQLPDGRYALPGSSLKGLLRSVVEIAGFGRMGKVDEVRPGLRDISKANTVYAQRVRDKVHTGFLRRRDDGSHEIVPCLMVRLHHRSLETALGVPAPIFAARQSVGKKYETWQRLCAERQIDPAQIRFELGQPDAARLFQGSLVGTPVFTGQISDSTKDKGKQRDFIFYSPRPQQAIAVPPSAWRDFLRIHGDEDGKADMSWPGYWKAQYRAGREVPVFYLQDGGLLRIGLAYMPKLAGDFSTYDMICHANPGHLHAPGAAHGYDLADLLFGAINGENQADALRGRVSFETAVAQGKPQPTKHGPTILNGPKPSYFPNYITQPGADPNTWRLRNGQPYATYIQTGSSKAPTLRGFKRYPVRPDAKVQPLTDEQESNKKVQIVLHTLPPQTRFDGRIVFHNLKPEELGALLWALTWGDDSAKRHSLGMGKPFGFGQAHIELNAARCRLIPNDPAQPETPLSDERRAQLLRQFGQQMNAAVPDWERSPQMLNLLAMADPGAAKQLPRGMELRHMKLEAKQRINEFQVAKQAQHVLADYAVATGAQNAGDWRPTQGKAHAECSRPGAAAAASPGNPKSPEPSAVSEQKTVWNNARLTWNKGSQTLEAVAPDGKRAQETRDTAKKLIAALPPEQGQRLDKKGELKGVTVEVKGMGNRFVIQRLIKGAG